MKKFLFIFILLLYFSVNIFPQSQLTGILKQDSRIAFEETKNIVPQFAIPERSRKSPMLAGLFSLLIPGAGELYAGEYLKAAIFLAVEAAVITTAIVYDRKGDNKTNEFENYADREWNVVKYAEWLNEYRDGNIAILNDPGLQPWERVNWDELNAAERSFSHKLPRHGDQQYYELIGKYPQYSPGWREFDPADSDYHNVPPQFLYYSGMRGKANDYYNVASKAVIGIYLNHFLSILDAVWSTAQYNKQISMSFRTENLQLAEKSELIPVLHLKYSF
jgi:hypothetical protein